MITLIEFIGMIIVAIIWVIFYNCYLKKEIKKPSIIDELSSKQEGKDEISLCKSCYCMTKTIKGKCGKCGSKK
jgi:phosphotransferase system  glucose/maltose/N-acetylglucosamine-specific IIC component